MHPYAERAWRKLPSVDVPLFRKALEHLAQEDPNAQIKRMHDQESLCRRKFGIDSAIYSIRANRERRILFAKQGPVVTLLDFVKRCDRDYFARER